MVSHMIFFQERYFGNLILRVCDVLAQNTKMQMMKVILGTQFL